MLGELVHMQAVRRNMQQGDNAECKMATCICKKAHWHVHFKTQEGRPQVHLPKLGGKLGFNK